MQTELGVLGAKVQSWARANPRDLLKSIIEANPTADEREIFRLLKVRLGEDDGQDYMDVILDYWFTNNFRSLAPIVGQSREARAATASIPAIKETIKERATTMVLMDLAMPNGLPLRDCTGADCNKFGGWLSAIAKKLKPQQKVGNALSEAQVRAMWAKHL